MASLSIYVDIYGTHVSHVSTLIQIKGYEMAQSAISTMSEVMCTCTLSHTYNILHCSKHGVVSDKADTKSLQRRYPTLFGRDWQHRKSDQDPQSQIPNHQNSIAPTGISSRWMQRSNIYRQKWCQVSLYIFYIFEEQVLSEAESYPDGNHKWKRAKPKSLCRI